MKNRIFKSIFALVLAFVALPMMGQDYLNVCFKKGESRKILLRNVTGIATSKSDDEGNISSDYHYLHISTEYNKYVYNLDDIDCISYKKCSESEVEGNMVNSYNALFPILDACESISDVEKRMEDIKDAEAVENAWSDGRYLYVKIKDGDTMSFCFNDEPDDEDNDDLDAKLSVLSSQIKSKIKKAESSGKENLKVAIVNQTKFNMHPSYVNGQNRLEKIGNLFKDIGITPTYVNPSLDFFYSGIFNYDVVILCTHGNVRILNDKSDYERDKDGDPIHTLCTSDVVGEHIGSNPSDGGEIVQQWKNTRNIIVSDKPYGDKIFNNENVGLPVEWHQELRDNLLIWIGYIAITENFFKYVSEGAFPDKSIMFAAVCHSNQGSSSLSRKLRNKNLGSYLGFDNQVRTSVATKAALSFFTSMMTGKSIEESYREMPDGYAYDWLNGASLFPYGFWSNFLFPTVTKQIEQTTAQNAFNSSGYVEVEGFTTCIDPNADDAVKMGFQYSTNEYFSPASSIVSSDVSKLTKPLDNGNGNVQFRAQLTGLQPGNTYHYRAYTYDGLNYNYGEPCSFEISGGETNITEGLVAYYPFNGNANDASGYGNHGILSGNNPPALTTDRYGRENSAYSFGGFKNYNWIKVPNSESLKFDKEMTISFWIQQSELAGMDGWGNYSTTSPSFAVICKAGDGIATYPGLYILTGKGKDGNGLKISNNISNGVLSIGYNKSDYQLGNWLHIVLVVNKSDKILYVDGIEVAHDQLNKENIFSSMNAQDLYFGIMASSNMTLGRYGSGAWYPFYGKIDDIRFYNRALDPSEISVLYNE